MTRKAMVERLHRPGPAAEALLALGGRHRQRQVIGDKSLRSGRNAFRLSAVSRETAVAVAAWFVALGLAVAALSAVARSGPAESPAALPPSVVVDPGVSEIDAGKPGFGVEITR